jgi:hypothetical protein
MQKYCTKEKHGQRNRKQIAKESKERRRKSNILDEMGIRENAAIKVA